MIDNERGLAAGGTAVAWSASDGWHERMYVRRYTCPDGGVAGFAVGSRGGARAASARPLCAADGALERRLDRRQAGVDGGGGGPVRSVVRLRAMEGRAAAHVRPGGGRAALVELLRRRCRAPGPDARARPASLERA